MGSKGSFDQPQQLIRTSQAGSRKGIIFVSINYRLGALGWLAGPTLQAAGGVANAGLHDQRLSISWVKKYIHLFGGDPNQITLLGESAGGGSIMHQITAYGGERPVSFHRAIIQSPALRPVTSPYVQENTTQNFLTLLNVSSIEEARQASSAAVIRANAIQIATSIYGQYTYGPVVDGSFVPALPGLLLNQGAFAKNITVMLGHNANEGATFTPPYVRTNADLVPFFRERFPTILPVVIDYISNVLYPPIYTAPATIDRPYTLPLERTAAIIADTVFTCNTHYLAKAFKNQTYNYEFQVPPAFHGQDLAYTFYQGQQSNITSGIPASLVPLAQVLQGYIVNFAMFGDPNGDAENDVHVPVFPVQGMNASMNALNVTGVTVQRDNTANSRCDWWQKALYS